MKDTNNTSYFGKWIKDENDLPAFKYTCNQVKDPKAHTPTNQAWRASNEHTFQLGNDRVIGLASNFGYVQVRQDEGVPKLLNDYLPDESSFGGGLGYLFDGENILSTYYDGQNECFERVYGIGYMLKTVWNSRYKVSQKIYAPFGDDPVFISEISITNLRDQDTKVDWFEYWSTHIYPLSYRALMLTVGKSDLSSLIEPEAATIRRDLAKRFDHSYKLLDDGAGICEEKKFKGWGQDKIIWEQVKNRLRAAAELTGNTSLYCPEIEQIEDTNPPKTFLYSLDGKADGYFTSAKDFFENGGAAYPEGLQKVDTHFQFTSEDNAMILKRSIELKAKESKSIYFLYGYIPEGFSLETILEKYKTVYKDVFASNSSAWKEDILGLEVQGKPWIEREMLWHNYYLRSNLTYDTYFKEYILSQGHIYQYIMGFQGAARDPLQHVMPFIFTQPWIVKSVLRYTLKEVLPDGEIPYGIVGHGCIMVSPIISSDFELWLLWAVSEYILATKDAAFLQEMIQPYPYKGEKREKQTVAQLLDLCYEHFIAHTGTGSHGLSRLLHGDWNDNIVIGSTDEESQAVIRAEGESVLVAAMAAYVLKYYSDMLQFIGEKEKAESITIKAEALRQAVSRQWNGKWFRRAYLSSELGWVGDDILWLEPQPWAIICGAAQEDQIQTLVKNIDELLRKPSPIGAMLCSKCLPEDKISPCMVTNGGIWLSINGTLIWALTQVDPHMAWDEWKKNTLTVHTEKYPDIWTGTWSGPDTYNSVLSEYPGNTHFEVDEGKHLRGLNWTDFPVLNMHPHAWPLYSISKFIISEFTCDGVTIKPILPEAEYSFHSPLFGFRHTSGRYEGWYSPKTHKNQTIKLILPDEERIGTLYINGRKTDYYLIEDSIVFGINKNDKWSWIVK